MTKVADNPNIEWKKTGVDDDERLSRKIDGRKAEEYNSKKKNARLNYVPVAENLGGGLKKIRKKISKDAFEEEEEGEENSQTILVQDNPLFNALNEDERKFLQQKNTISNGQTMEETGRMSAIAKANQLAKGAGLSGLDKKIVDKRQNDVTLSSGEALKKVIKEDLVKDSKIKWQDVSEKDLPSLLKGVKKVKDLGGAKAVEGMKVKEAVDIGSRNNLEEKELAKLILEKSGREHQNQKKLKKQMAENTTDKELKKELIEKERQKHRTNTREQKER